MNVRKADLERRKAPLNAGLPALNASVVSLTRERSEHISSSRIIAINTLAAYVRIAVCGVLTLLSSRWILHALGEVDYGLFFVIWGAVGALAFFTTAMAMSAQRHFAYSIGQGDINETNRWFNASVAVHVCLALVLVAVGLFFGRYLIESFLNIPPNRVAVCDKVFVCLLATVFVRVLITPWLGFLTAKQRIFELAGWQILQAMAIFVLAFLLVRSTEDRLLTYTLWVTAISVAIALLQFIRCNLAFQECKLHFKARISYCKDLLSFGGWNLFGALAGIGQRQGTAFLINIFCGAGVNSSYGVANQVADAGEGVAVGLSNAMLPEIASSEGRGERERVIQLSLLSSKLAVLLFCILVIPLLGEINTVLALWLHDVPAHTAYLCCIVLISLLLDKLTIGYMAALFAKGDIAGYQASLGCIGLTAPLIGWVLFKQGFGIELSVGCALLIPRTLATLGRLFWSKRLLDIPVGRWCSAVLLRCLLVVVFPVTLMVLIYSQWTASLLRTLCSFAICGVTMIVSIWLVGLNSEEKKFLIFKLKSMRQA